MFIRFLVFITISFLLVIDCFAYSYAIKRGDTFSSILSNIYPQNEISDVIREVRSVYPSLVLKHSMQAEIFEDKISIVLDDHRELFIERVLPGLNIIKLDIYEEEVITAVVQGKILSNLFDAVRRSGEDLELAARLAIIFEWEIDFLKDLRVGDKFSVVVEKRFVNNKFVGYGKVLAADFINQGKVTRAFYYNNGSARGYYSKDGRGLERGFLRVPLNYAIISSRFSSSRKHPVFGDYRAHYGVDYAAPHGTPVKATASGVIDIMGFEASNGNYVAIRHPNGYKTYYLHLSKFNNSIRKGSPVSQGQVIGYVGSTGHSTGAHLDYRINKSGAWLDPLKFLPTPQKLKNDEAEHFKAQIEPMEELLNRAFHIRMVEN